MQYNYSFEAASLLFMLLIFVHFMVVWQFPTEKTRVFRALLIVCIGESALIFIIDRTGKRWSRSADRERDTCVCLFFV
mgnify:CR=1 FL=1